MAGWIGMNNPDATRLLDRAGQDDCAQFDSPMASSTEIGNGHVEMKLLRRAIWPSWREIWHGSLKGQLERRITDMDLTPVRIRDVRLPIQKVRVEGRKS
jgi:hypothetical protein